MTTHSKGNPGNDVDGKITRALAADEQQAGFGPGDQSLLQEVQGAFRGRQRWLNLLGTGLQLIYLCLCIWCAYRFFGAETTRDQVLFASGFLASLGVTMAFKMWFWMVLNRNAVLREVKRLELQVARLHHD